VDGICKYSGASLKSLKFQTSHIQTCSAHLQRQVGPLFIVNYVRDLIIFSTIT
jgi:hypothetical protein